MKKVLVAAIALFAFSFANAQDMRFGVKAGLFVSSYDGFSLHQDEIGNTYEYYNYYNINDYDSNTSKAGIYMGGLVDFNLIDDFRLQPELTLSLVPDSDYGYIAINVPVLVKYSFFDKFYAMAGPAFNYAIDGDSEQFSPSFDLGASYDLMDNFYVEVRADIGIAGYLKSNLNAGIGYRF